MKKEIERTIKELDKQTKHKETISRLLYCKEDKHEERDRENHKRAR